MGNEIVRVLAYVRPKISVERGLECRVTWNCSLGISSVKSEKCRVASRMSWGTTFSVRARWLMLSVGNDVRVRLFSPVQRGSNGGVSVPASWDGQRNGEGSVLFSWDGGRLSVPALRVLERRSRGTERVFSFFWILFILVSCSLQFSPDSLL